MKGARWDEAELDALLEAAAADLVADGRPHAEDDALVARTVAGAVARAGARRGRDSGRRPPWARRGMLLAAAVLVVASGAFALMRDLRARDRKGEPPATSEAVATPPSPSRETMAARAEVANDPAPSAEPAAVPPPLLSPSPAPEPGARELFAQANDTRRQGDPAGAARQYVALQRRYPRSPEARLSLLALGRLDLDRLDDPRRALAQFDDYLAGRDDGELREEAMVGRALALQRLGRAADEKAAWNALLAAFPGSLSADRANARLTELH